uniref:Uncharacterized protein n=1 Tax=Meloidogyne enterolobii TaxID=390850 RepID=A0A6V7V0E6_MELEN|nr:unnamed protein product [Meloidogyne enterolobii]
MHIISDIWKYWNNSNDCIDNWADIWLKNKHNNAETRTKKKKNAKVFQRQTPTSQHERPNQEVTEGNATMLNLPRVTTTMFSRQVKEEIKQPVIKPQQESKEYKEVKEESKKIPDATTTNNKAQLISADIKVTAQGNHKEGVSTIIRLGSRSQICYTVKEATKPPKEVFDNIHLKPEGLIDTGQPRRQSDVILIHTLAKTNEIITSEITHKNDNDDHSVNPEETSKEPSQPIRQNPYTSPPNIVSMQSNRQNDKWDKATEMQSNDIDTDKPDKTIFEPNPSTNPGWFGLILILRVVIGIIQYLRPLQLHVFNTSKVYIRGPMHDSYSKTDDKAVCIWSIRHDQYSLLANCATYPTNNVDTSHETPINDDGRLFLNPRANFCNGPETLMKSGIWILGKTSIGLEYIFMRLSNISNLSSSGCNTAIDKTKPISSTSISPEYAFGWNLFGIADASTNTPKPFRPFQQQKRLRLFYHSIQRLPFNLLSVWPAGCSFQKKERCPSNGNIFDKWISTFPPPPTDEVNEVIGIDQQLSTS